MGKGLAQAIIKSAADVWGGAYPGEKITPLGWMQFLMGNSVPKVISQAKDDGSGYIRDVVVRMMQRSGAGKSVTEDNCTVQTKGAYVDQNIGTTLFRALGITFEDDQIAQFERDALAWQGVGTPSTNVMREVMDVILANANGLLIDINNDLLGLQGASFGKNQTTGLNTAKNVNFALDATQNNLAQGMTMVMADAYANEMRLAGSSIVGGGLVLNYYLQQAAKTAAQNGLDTSKLILPDFKFDPYVKDVWGGDNYFGLFERNAVQFVNICRFRGSKAGTKGKSYFFTMRLPVQDSVGQGGYSGFEFDVQLTYRDCPEEVQIGVAGPDNPPVAMGRGWNIILMSSYSQVNIPTNAYEATDRLFGNNGTYLFNAQNA